MHGCRWTFELRFFGWWVALWQITLLLRSSLCYFAIMTRSLTSMSERPEVQIVHVQDKIGLNVFLCNSKDTLFVMYRHLGISRCCHSESIIVYEIKLYLWMVCVNNSKRSAVCFLENVWAMILTKKFWYKFLSFLQAYSFIRICCMCIKGM